MLGFWLSWCIWIMMKRDQMGLSISCVEDVRGATESSILWSLGILSAQAVEPNQKHLETQSLHPRHKHTAYTRSVPWLPSPLHFAMLVPPWSFPTLYPSPKHPIINFTFHETPPRSCNNCEFPMSPMNSLTHPIILVIMMLSPPNDHLQSWGWHSSSQLQLVL